MMDMHKRKCKFYAILSVVLILLFSAAFGIAAFAKYSEKVSPNGQMSVTLMTEPGTMLPQNTWYKGSTDKASITKVKFVKNLPEGRAYSEQWDASELQDGRITVAVDGTTLYISSNGADVIYANPDSAEMFGDYDVKDIWSSLETIENASMLDTSKVTSMKDMFTGCLALKSVDVSQWDTSNVTNMSETFMACFALESVDVSGWDTGNVKDMSYIFSNSNYLRPIGIENWDTHNVTNMGCMFMRGLSDDVRDDPWTLDLSGWDTSNVTNMESIFSKADIAELNISGWDTSNVTTARSAFESGMTSGLRKITVGDKVGTILLSELPSFNEAELEGADGKWYAESDGKGYSPADIPGNKADTYYASAKLLPMPPTMAAGDTWYKGITSKASITQVNFVKKLPTEIEYSEQWDASAAQDGGITAGISETTLYISSNGFNEIMANEDSSSMFSGFLDVTSINGLDMLDVSEVKNMSNMFENCIALRTMNVSNWETGEVTDMSNLFSGCIALETLDVSHWDTSAVTNMNNMFSTCAAIKTLDISNWNTSAVTNMSYMFYHCTALITLDLSGWNTSAVTDMSNMFSYCTVIETLHVPNWKTGTVTDMSFMFYNCYTLETLDLSGWDVSAVTDMNFMFRDCTALKTMDLSGWETSRVSSVDAMFLNCNNLQKIMVGNDVTSLVLNELPAPSATYIDGADGKWYAESNRTGYARGSIPGNKADTYYASANLLPKPPTMAAGNTWYKGTTAKASITQVNFVKKLPTEVEYSEQWDASEAQDGGITAAISGTTLYISSNGANEIAANANSNYLFESFTSTREIHGLELLNTSTAENLEGMFSKCYKLKEIDVSSFDTSNVTNFRYVFYSCQALTSLDLSTFDMSKATDITALVENCTNLETLNIAWNDTSNIVHGGGFYYSYNIREITVSDKVSSVVLSCLPNPNGNFIPGADGKWYAESSEVGYYPAEIPTGKTDTYYASKDLIPPPKMLSGSTWFGNRVAVFRITAVKFVKELPSDVTFTLQWDVSEAQNGSITAAYGANTVYICTNGRDKIMANEDMSGMFSGWNMLKSVTGTELLDTSKTTSMQSAFHNDENLRSLDLSSWDTSSVTNMSYMFCGCTMVNQLNIDKWDVSNVSDMSSMFQSCGSLQKLNLGDWDTHNVENISMMLISSLVSEFDMHSWDTSKVNNAERFLECPYLEKVIVGPKVTSTVLENLPSQDSSDIQGADGKWYAESDAQGYLPAEIPGNKADTYYASPLLLPTNTLSLNEMDLNAFDSSTNEVEESSDSSHVNPDSEIDISNADSSSSASVPDSMPDSSTVCVSEATNEASGSNTCVSEEDFSATENQGTSESGVTSDKPTSFSSSLLSEESSSSQSYTEKAA